MKNLNLESINYEEFTNEFVQTYLSRGFGNMPKRELDVFIFHLLKKHKTLNENSNHLMAMQLRTTPVKVKSYNYESILRFPSLEDNIFTESYFKNKLKEYFKNPIYIVRENEQWIYIQINDPFLMESFKAIALNNKEIIDKSFNNEIVKISFEGFIVVLQELISKDELEIIENQINKLDKKKTTISLKSIGDKTLSAIISTGIREAVPHIKLFTQAILDADYIKILEIIQKFRPL